MRTRTHARNPCMRAPSAKLALTYHHGDGDLLHFVATSHAHPRGKKIDVDTYMDMQNQGIV